MMKKKAVSLLICGALTLSLVTPALAAPSDLDGHWAEDAMNTWMDYGVIRGYEDGTVKPNNSITRGELAVMLDRMMGYQTQANNTFSDLGDNWYTDAILSANKAGIIGGYANGTVKPNATITRQEAVVMIARALSLSGTAGASNIFTDSGEIAPWALDAINAMVDAGYIHGSNGAFRPDDGITRAEVVTILDNIFGGFYQASGTYTENVDGSLVINSGDVSLDGITITGDLIIAEGVSVNSIVLDDVTVEGRIIVRGGGTGSDAVVIKGDSDVETVIVQRQDEPVEIDVQDSATVDEVIASTGTENVAVSGSVDTVTVDDENTVVEINGTVNTLTVTENADNADVTVAKGARVGSVTTSADNTNMNVAGTVKDVTVAEGADNATVSTESGAKVDSVTTSGAGTTVEGSGTVSKVEAAEGSTGATVTTPGTTVENNGTGSVDTGKGEVKPGDTTTTPGGSSGGSSSGGGSSVPSYTASTLTTNIGQQAFYVGVPTEFTFTTTANDDAGKMVIGTSNFSNAEAIEKLEYYEVKNGQWYELKGDFGPSTGFPMSDATSRFRVTFKTAGEYTFTASMKLADGGTVLCSTNVNFTVSAKPENIAVVANESALNAALENNGVETIYLKNDFSVDAKITVSRPVTIDGNGYTITASESWSGSNNSNKHLLGVEGISRGDVKLVNVMLNSANKAYGVQPYITGGNKLVLENVTIQNSAGTGLTVNGSTVEATNLSISGSGWGQSIDVSKGQNVDGAATLVLDSVNGLQDTMGIVEDGAKTATITVGGTSWSANGVLINDSINKNSYIKYVYAPNGVPTQWTVPASGELQNNITVPAGTTLTVPEKVTLTVGVNTELIIEDGGKLINNGNIVCDIPGSEGGESGKVIQQVSGTLSGGLSSDITHYRVMGDTTVDGSCTIPEGAYLEVEKDATLTVPTGASLTSNGAGFDSGIHVKTGGTLTVEGTVTIKGQLYNEGTINGTGTIYAPGYAKNNGSWEKLFSSGYGTEQAPYEINNLEQLENAATLQNSAGSTNYFVVTSAEIAAPNNIEFTDAAVLDINDATLTVTNGMGSIKSAQGKSLTVEGSGTINGALYAEKNSTLIVNADSSFKVNSDSILGWAIYGGTGAVVEITGGTYTATQEGATIDLNSMFSGSLSMTNATVNVGSASVLDSYGIRANTPQILLENVTVNANYSRAFYSNATSNIIIRGGYFITDKQATGFNPNPTIQYSGTLDITGTSITHIGIGIKKGFNATLNYEDLIFIPVGENNTNPDIT